MSDIKPTSDPAFRVLKRSRKRPEVGDIFTFQINDHPDRFYFGRVIATDTNIGGFPDVNLIYIYRKSSPDKQKIPSLITSDLLVPPKGINTLPWTKGYFEFVRSSEIKPADRLTVHCFLNPLTKGYVDEYGRPLLVPTEPVGFDALNSYRTLSEAIYTALDLETK